MKRLAWRFLLLLVAKLGRRQAWKLARRTAGKQIKRQSRRLARALRRRSIARIVHWSASAIGKSPLRATDVGERVILRLFRLAARLRQG